MSIPRQIDVCCPKCGKSFKTTVFQSVNTDYSVDTMNDVISGDLFTAKCPKCNHIAHLEYDVLFHDMKHGAMIWVLHKNNADYDSKLTEIRSVGIIPYNVTRVVGDINALREKAACLEAEKDDRIIELCKFYLLCQFMQEKSNLHLKNAFYTYSNGKDIIFFYDENGKEYGCDLAQDLYNLIADIFKEPLEQMDTYPYKIIDFDWASEFINLIPTDKIEKYKKQKAFSSGSTGEEELSENKLVKCPKCSNLLPEDSLFCQYCGFEIKSEPVIDNGFKNPDVEIKEQEKSSTKKKFIKKTGQIKHCKKNIESKVSRKKHQIKLRPAIISLILVSVLLISSVGLNIYQYDKNKDNLSIISEQNNTIDKQKNTIASNDSTIAELNEKISDNKEKAGYYDEIIEALRNGKAGYATKNFHASQNVIIVRENKQKTFTLTAYWPNGGSVTISYGFFNDEDNEAATVSFDKDEWDTSVTMNVEGQRKGITTATFTNSVDSSEFNVIIIVTA